MHGRLHPLPMAHTSCPRSRLQGIQSALGMQGKEVIDSLPRPNIINEARELDSVLESKSLKSWRTMSFQVGHQLLCCIAIIWPIAETVANDDGIQVKLRGARFGLATTAGLFHLGFPGPGQCSSCQRLLRQCKQVHGLSGDTCQQNGSGSKTS